MSYNPVLLFQKISSCLRECPTKTLTEVSQYLGVSKRTIENAVRVRALTSFRCFRRETLVICVKCTFMAQPQMAIKELCYGLGFKSPASFARAIKRATGLSPEAFRSLVAEGLLISPNPEYSQRWTSLDWPKRHSAASA
jgi:AraC-like DNA-binding protein